MIDLRRISGAAILFASPVLVACGSPEAEAPASASSEQPAAVEAAAPDAADDTQWRLVWSDEFDGDAIDPERWNREFDCWGGGNDERQCYTRSDENSFIDDSVEDGVLVIRAQREDAEGPAWPAHMMHRITEEQRNETATNTYTSARLNTKNKGDWTYGRIEVRARLPEGQGTWAAIWMLPTDEVYGPWALSGEIDILEAINLGEPCETCPGGIENSVLGTLHFGGAWPQNAYQGVRTSLPTREGDAQQFHVFATEWTEGKIEFFLDGESYGYLTPEDWRTDSELAEGNPNAPFDQRFHLILNLAVGGNLAEDHNIGGVREEIFPQTLEIDWVRVYDCPADLETARACAAQ